MKAMAKCKLRYSNPPDVMICCRVWSKKNHVLLHNYFSRNEYGSVKAAQEKGWHWINTHLNQEK